MQIPFSNALYYPHIDIRNFNWLKTATLFWDSISTIVPSSQSKPYLTCDTEFLSDIGFLRPIHVNSTSPFVVGIEDTIIELMSSPKFFNEFFFSDTADRQVIYEEKMSDELRQKIKEAFGVYTDKFSYKVRDKLHQALEDRIGIYNSKISHRLNKHLEFLLYEYPHFIEGDRFYLSSKFAYVYMTALANHICENKFLGLVTDNNTYHEYANSFKLNNSAGVVSNHSNIGQGLLLDLIIEDLKICPDTSFDDLMKFKKKHKDELTSFRVKLAELTQSVSADKPIGLMRSEIADIYKVFEAEYNNLKKALRSKNIKWVANNFLKVETFVAGTVGTALAGLPFGVSLLAGAGASAIVSVVNYNLDKSNQLRDNPYSYLLTVDRTEW